MTPKFSVGEVVILQSVSRPESNGEYIVAVVAGNYEEFIDPHFGSKRMCRGPGTGYVLSDPLLVASLDYASTAIKSSAIWAESALRKKHQPGELSYSQLLESLTTKQGAPA